MTNQIFLPYKSFRFLSAAAALAVAAGIGIHAAEATTYYVSSLTGNDHNSGTSTASPLKTINAITNAGHFASGDTVVVMPGTYYETVRLTTPGTAGAYTTLMAQPGAARPIIIGAPTQPQSADNYAAINIWASYTRVVGFDVSWQGADGTGINSWGPTAPDSMGTLRPAVHHVDIENNVAHDAGCGGINTENADYVTIRGNVVYNNGHLAPNQCSGISLLWLTDLDSAAGFHNLISDNLSYANIDQTPVPGQTYTTDGNGIIIDDSRHTECDGVVYHGATLVYGNIVVGNGARGIHVYASDNVTVANNTAYGNQQSSTVSGAVAEYSSIESGSVTFVNNIAYSRGPRYPTFTDDKSNHDKWDYNISTGGGNQLISPVALTIGTHNLAGVNPKFDLASTNLASANFQLSSNSPAIKAGVALGYTVPDFGGKVVATGTRPNMGAYSR